MKTVDTLASPGPRRRPFWSLGLKGLRRDFGAGELTFLFLALVVAVTAITSVGFLAERFDRALSVEGAQLLGGDLVLESDAPLAPAVASQARSLKLSEAQTQQFPSMASADNQTHLVAVKAVDGAYPLGAALQVADTVGGPVHAETGGPAPGTVWVDTQLLDALALKPGQTLSLGNSQFRIAGVLVYEPDRGLQFLNLNPRVMMRSSDLAATGLTGLGSRVQYTLAVMGAAPAVSQFQQWLTPQLQRGQQLRTPESGRPEVNRTMDRARQMLQWVALLAAVVASMAVGLAARRFMARHRDGVATMRCLGATRRQILGMLAVEFVLIGLAAAVVGALVGYALQQIMVWVLGNLVGGPLPAPSLLPVAQGLVVTLWLLVGFAWPALITLTRVAPIQVLHADRETPVPGRDAWGYAVGLVGIAVIIAAFAGWTRLAVYVTGGFFGMVLAFFVVGGLLVTLLARYRRVFEPFAPLRFALAGLARRRLSSVIQMSSLAVGLTALLLLAMTRTDLLQAWQQTLPADAPNHFVINIQTDQRAALQAEFAKAGLHDVSLYPMIRGRLIRINDHDVQPDDYASLRVQRLARREFNLSYASQAPNDDEIVAGRWLNPAEPEVSMETGIAKDLGVSLGDWLVFDVAGQSIRVHVTSLRHADWESMHVNFFAILSPSALSQAPQTWVTSFHLPAGQSGAVVQWLRQFPNLTVIDIDAIVSQLQSVLSQIVGAVQCLFLLALLAGALVLAVALQSTRDERRHEAALLRALGASRERLAGAQRAELIVIGTLAGLMAAGAATAMLHVLAVKVFNLPVAPGLWPWLAGAVGGALIAWACGAWALRGVLRTPPLAILREA